MAPPRKSPLRRRLGRGIWLLAVVALAAGGYAGWRHYHDGGRTPDGNTAAQNGAAQHPGPTSSPTPIPVTTANAVKADFPVYLEGLGTVQPFDTVTIRSRVDGEVIKIGFKQGQMVKEGDLLVQIDPRPYQAALDQAKAKKAQDEAMLKNAQLDLQRFSTLAERSFASRQQIDTQTALVAQLIAQIQGDQAAIDNAQTQLGYTSINSPLTGRAGFRLIDPGNIIHASDVGGVVTIVRLQPISVVFTAPEEDLPKINQALSAGRVPVEALTTNGEKVLSKGRLALLNNQVDQATGTISMKASFDNADNALWPGLSVSTRLLVNTLPQVTVVPSDAVQRGPNGPYAFTVGKDNRAEMRDIKVANIGQGKAVITQGIVPGDKVVIAGQYRLMQGALVAPIQAKAAPEDGNVAQAESGGTQ